MRVVSWTALGVLLWTAAADARLQGGDLIEFDEENEGYGLISAFEDENGMIIDDEEVAPPKPKPRGLLTIFGYDLGGDSSSDEEAAERNSSDDKKEGGRDSRPWWAKAGLGSEKPASSSDSDDNGNHTEIVEALAMVSPPNTRPPSNMTVPPMAFHNFTGTTPTCSAKEHECDLEYGGKGVYICRKIPEGMRLGDPHSHVTKCLHPDMALMHDKCGCCRYGCTPRCPCPCDVKPPIDAAADGVARVGWSMVMYNDPNWKICVPEDDLETLAGIGNAMCDMSCVVDKAMDQVDQMMNDAVDNILATEQMEELNNHMDEMTNHIDKITEHMDVLGGSDKKKVGGGHKEWLTKISKGERPKPSSAPMTEGDKKKRTSKEKRPKPSMMPNGMPMLPGDATDGPMMPDNGEKKKRKWKKEDKDEGTVETADEPEGPTIDPLPPPPPTTYTLGPPETEGPPPPPGPPF